MLPKEALAVEIQQLEAASLREQQHIDRLQQWMKSYKKLMEDTDNRKKQEGLRVQRALEEKAAAERAAAMAAAAAVAAADRKKRKSDAAAEAAGGKVAGDDDDNSEEERDGSSGRVWRRLLGGGSGRRRDTKRGSFLFRSPVKASRSRASSMRAKNQASKPISEKRRAFVLECPNGSMAQGGGMGGGGLNHSMYLGSRPNPGAPTLA